MLLFDPCLHYFHLFSPNFFPHPLIVHFTRLGTYLSSKIPPFYAEIFWNFSDFSYIFGGLYSDSRNWYPRVLIRSLEVVVRCSVLSQYFLSNHPHNFYGFWPIIVRFSMNSVQSQPFLLILTNHHHVSYGFWPITAVVCITRTARWPTWAAVSSKCTRSATFYNWWLWNSSTRFVRRYLTWQLSSSSLIVLIGPGTA